MIHREALFAMAPPVDLRSIAGKNPAPTRRVPVVVVGGGPAGVAAATAAARAGARSSCSTSTPSIPSSWPWTSRSSSASA